MVFEFMFAARLPCRGAAITMLLAPPLTAGVCPGACGARVIAADGDMAAAGTLPPSSPPLGTVFLRRGAAFFSPPRRCLPPAGVPPVCRVP